MALTAHTASAAVGNVDRAVSAPSPTEYPQLDLRTCPGLVVVAARPDDELLGLGGTIAALVDLGVEVRVMSVCDRDAALRLTGLPALDRQFPEQRFDQHVAAGILGVKELTHLGLPSGDLHRHAAELTDLVADALQADVWCAVPWGGDDDPDTTVVATAAAAAARRTGARPLQYPVWFRHLPSVSRPTLPWDRLHTVAVPESAHMRKHSAVEWYIGSFRPDARPLLASVLYPQLAIGETVFV